MILCLRRIVLVQEWLKALRKQHGSTELGKVTADAAFSQLCRRLATKR